MSIDNHFALIMGVADYRHIMPLSSAVEEDAKAIQQLLTDKDYCAYPAENVLLMLNDEATYSSFCHAFEWLAECTDENSSIVIYFTGHGGRLREGGQNQTYLLPVDAQFSADQSTLENSMSGTVFNKYLHNIPSRKVLVVFDCCHAGGIGQPKSIKDIDFFKSGLDERYYKALAAGRGRAIMASSLESEYSAILPGDAHSLFTKHLIAGLKGGVSSSDGVIRIFELFNYVQMNVTQEYAKQSPFFQCALQDNFPVALYKAGKKERYIEPKQSDEKCYDFDVYISCMIDPDDNEDVVWVEDVLIPQLVDVNLKVAWALDSAVAGVATLDSDAIGMTRSRRTIVVLSGQALSDHWAKVESMAAQYIGIREGTWRVLPVYREAIEKGDMPVRLTMLTQINLAPRRAEREMTRLINALHSPLPKIS